MLHREWALETAFGNARDLREYGVGHDLEQMGLRCELADCVLLLLLSLRESHLRHLMLCQLRVAFLLDWGLRQGHIQCVRETALKLIWLVTPPIFLTVDRVVGEVLKESLIWVETTMVLFVGCALELSDGSPGGKVPIFRAFRIDMARHRVLLDYLLPVPMFAQLRVLARVDKLLGLWRFSSYAETFNSVVGVIQSSL